jgi:FdhE protein
LEKLKKRIQILKKKRPGYEEILDFYYKIKEEQKRIKTSLNIKPVLLKKERKKLLTQEGFPLLQREGFPLDMEASVTLFQSLCQIGRKANPHLSEQVRKIEEALDQKRIDLKELLKEKNREKKADQITNELGLDQKVFIFLIQNSIQPSIEVTVEKLRNELKNETWLKGYCPMCGSLPSLSLLREEVGKRYLLCSYCGYEWQIDRVICPFCNNHEQDSLHYFYGEGEESYRIDLCDRCHQYIKTLDLRKMEAPDCLLEDLATLHLDLLASQKGYQRPVPMPWTP